MCPLLALVLALTASGCLGSGTAAPTPTPTQTTRTPRDRVAVSVTLGLNTQSHLTHHYLLTCDPAGGTMPHPIAACHAIADYLGRHIGEGGACVGVLVRSTAMASLVGTFRDRPFTLRIDNTSWCGEPRPVMRDYWTLSTFPCSTIVIHTGDTPSYTTWAKTTGCETTDPSR